MNFQLGQDFFLGDFLIPLNPDLPDQRAFAHPVGQHAAAVVLGQPCLDILEETHLIDGSNIGINRLMIERLAGPG